MWTKFEEFTLKFNELGSIFHEYPHFLVIYFLQFLILSIAVRF